ncbi:hypothetical protein HY643_00550 [Candidatus Woesearchaeota archaeon]|nr:hypothetical protein [Candidatus Woesearchaeota archaeon]
MGLDKIFQEKAEKPAEERKLQVIITEEVVVDDLTAYFERSIPPKLEVNGYWDDDFKKYFNHLSNFNITPKLIAQLNEKIPNKGKPLDILHRPFRLCTPLDYYNSYKGIFLSALIQASYNKGFNNFELGEINADHFGCYLKGKAENPIKLKIGKINGSLIFRDAINYNCSGSIALSNLKWD